MIKIHDGKRFKANALNGQNKSQPHTRKPPLKKDNLKPKPPDKKLIEMSNKNAINSVECDQCGMSFLNVNLLQMHKEQFCLGQVTEQRTSSPPIQTKYIQNQFKNQLKDSQAYGSPRQPLSRISIGSESNLNPIKTQSAINQLMNFKTKKSIEQSLRDMEDTLIRDTIRDKKLATSFHESPAPGVLTSNQYPRSVLSQSQFSPSDPFRDLLKEYGDFKKKEKSVLQEIYDYSPDLIPFKTVENKENTADINTSSDFLSLFDNSELDIIEDFDAIDYLDTIDFTPSQPKKITQQAAHTNAKKKTNNKNSKSDAMNSDQATRANLKRIQDKTLQLEKDRREIQFKLENLRNDGSIPLPVQSNQSINRILSELRDQQRINEAALSMLGQRLNGGPQPVPNNTFGAVRSSNNVNRVDFSKYLNGPYHNYNIGNEKLPHPNDDSYTAEEIRIMRLNYLQSGGHDPSVLHKFTEMEYEARFKDTTNPAIPQTTRFSSRPPNQIDPFSMDLDNKIRKVDQENKRLQAELELLQNKYESLSNLRSPNPSGYEAIKKRTDTSLPPIHQPSPPIQQRIRYYSPTEHMPNLVPQNRFLNPNDDEFYQLSPKNGPFNAEFNQSFQPNQKPFQPNKASLKNDLNTPKLLRLKDLPPSPYDPVGGFVIFIDFITNVDPAYACARVITCLHHPKSGLGEPSVLPIVNCESFLEHNNRSTIALISTKQPVPRCPPQQALTILVELQMAIKDPNETKLKSCAWSKIQLFDTKNRLLSGRWKLSLKNLPIKSDANINSLDTFNSFGSTELYYRLVNLRDSDEQTNAPISPAYANQYIQTTQH